MTPDLPASSRIVDLTHQVHDGMPWFPTHAPFQRERTEDQTAGDPATTYRFTMNEHTGTHVDAPSHFVPHDHPGHVTVDELAPDRLLARAVSVDATGIPAGAVVPPELIEQAESRHGRLGPDDVVLVHTGQSRHWSDPARYLHDWAALAEATAKLLVDRQVRAVGIDAASIDRPASTAFPVHQTLLAAGILVIENLANLDQLPAVSTLVALPLPFRGGSGSPVRAIALVSDAPAATPTPDDDVAAVRATLAHHGYVADDGLATVVHLAELTSRPLLLEGESGTGKTELARSLARRRDVPLVRLQCHEGLDATQAMYEWDHARQLLHLQALRVDGQTMPDLERDLYTDRFLLERPLLQSLRRAPDVVLLIDEIDRADIEFEAFLLEFLADFQMTIPEYGTIRADHPPTVVLTSNRTRELHEALRRRCLYHWMDHPDLEHEVQIIRAQVPAAPPLLARRTAELIARLRSLDLFKAPGAAEAVDWTRLLHRLGAHDLDEPFVRRTLGAIIKDPDDLRRVHGELEHLLS